MCTILLLIQVNGIASQTMSPRYADFNYKQLLDEVFVICGIINVEVRVISRAEDEADTSYRDIDNPHITKTESDNCFIIHCKRRK